MDVGDKPSVAVRLRVDHQPLTGDAVGHDVVLRIECPEDIPIQLGEIAGNQVLVATQLCRIVPTDGAVVVGGGGVVEGIDRQVHHPRLGGIAEDLFVHRRLLLHLRRNVGPRVIHRVVEVPLVHRPEVDKAEQRHKCQRRHRLHLLLIIKEQHPHPHEEIDQRPQRVGSEDCRPDALEILHRIDQLRHLCKVGSECLILHL